VELILPILKETEWFREFSVSELADLIGLCRTVNLAKGTVVFQEGSVDDRAVYFIESGVIKIVKGEGERRKILALFGLGNWFGDMSFLTPGPRSASAVADEDVVLHQMQPAGFRELEQRLPQTALKILKVFIAKLVTRLRQTDEALVQRGPKIIIT
jgi:CRP/FNR family cyclic AMP-dependent transcriptional regulator